MKKILSFFAMAAMLSLACSCSPKDPEKPNEDNPQPGPTPTETVINEITATLDGAGIKTVWTAGDAVIVYAVTDAGDVSAKYVLAEGAGAATGKFTVEGTGLNEGASAYYASYPYSNIDFAQHNTFSFTLEAEQSAANPVFGKTSDGKSYTFSTPLAGIEFKLTGKGNAGRIFIEDANTESILNGNAEFNAMTSKLKLKNVSSSKNTVAKSFESTTLGESAASFLMEVPAGTFSTGGTVSVYNPANGLIGKAEIPAQNLAAGTVTPIELALEEVSSVADLSEIESANCYIITEPGSYRFKTVRGNTPASVGAVASADIVWETYGNMDEVVANSVIAEVSYATDYITFKTPAALKKGNALIAAKDAEGVILWSWHIWVVADQAIAATDLGFNDGSQMMNYNLGALGEPGTPESFGLVYQWGRKDPFVAGGSLGHSDVATVAGTAWTVTPEQAKVSSDFANQNPTVFADVTGSDGMKDWLDVTDPTRWATTKGMHDPCPAGWRVPAEEDAPNFFSSSLTIVADYNADEPENSTFSFTVNNSYVLPLGGTIGYGGGEYSKSDCKFFTCSGADGEYADAIRIQKGGAPAYGIRRKAETAYIRCVADVAAE